LNTARLRGAGAGTQTAGLMFGGTSPSTNETGDTEEYNGSSWSEQNNLGEVRARLGGAGTQTAGLAFGGSSPGVSLEVDTEEYNGTSWSEGGTASTLTTS